MVVVLVYLLLFLVPDQLVVTIYLVELLHVVYFLVVAVMMVVQDVTVRLGADGFIGLSGGSGVVSEHEGHRHERRGAKLVQRR